MPITYEWDRTAGRVYTTVIGAVTVDDIVNHLQTALRDEFLSIPELIDARGVGYPHLSPTEVWTAAGRVRATKFGHQSFGPHAVVVDDLAMFGMTRMFVTLVSDLLPMNVFRNVSDAEDWLAGKINGAA